MLGESRDTLTAYDRPLQVATTDSIDALRAFELGMELRTRADNVRAIPALKTAVALDPQFALAYAQLGSAYSNTGDTTSATPYLRKAFELRDRATEPERLYITGRYFDIVTGELEKGAETYRLWTRMYPGEWLAFNALANDANLMGRYQIARGRREHVPSSSSRGRYFGQTNLLTALVALNRFDEAKSVAGRMLEQDPDNSSAHTARYAMADFLGDTAARDRELAWSRTTADGSGVIYVEAESAAQHGRFAESTRLFQDVVRTQSGLHNDAAAANTLSEMASYDALAGLDGPAKEAVDASVALARTDTSVGVAAIVYGLLRRAHDTQAQLDAFDLDRPLSTLNIGVFAPTARMALALDGPRYGRRGDASTGVDGAVRTGSGGRSASRDRPRPGLPGRARARSCRSGVPENSGSRGGRPGLTALLTRIRRTRPCRRRARQARRQPQGLCGVPRFVEGRGSRRADFAGGVERVRDRSVAGAHSLMTIYARRLLRDHRCLQSDHGGVGVD